MLFDNMVDTNCSIWCEVYHSNNNTSNFNFGGYRIMAVPNFFHYYCDFIDIKYLTQSED